MDNQDLITTVKELINAGCHYDLDTLSKLYAKDLKIIILQENGEYIAFNYEENMQFFQNLKDTNAPPLNTTAIFNFAEIQNNIGYVSVTRNLNLGFGEKKIVFQLMLGKTTNHWQIFREQAVIIGNA